jgi:hypothetical protein
MADSGIPLGVWSGADATNALREEIAKYNAQAAKQAETMIRLTWAIVALTVVLVAGLVVQIVLAV